MPPINPNMLGSLGNQPQVRSLLQMLGWEDPNAGGGGGGAAIGGSNAGGGAPGGAGGGGGGGGGGAPGGAPVGGGGQSGDPYAAEKAMYGSFDLRANDGEPRISDAATAATQGGTSLAGLMGGFFPRYVSDNVQGYKIPSDQGGFFTAADLFRHSPQGSVPQIGQFMQDRPSTNNWRLLGMGPGWIMRNGQLIDTNSTGARWGGSSSWMPSGGNSGEQSMPAIGTGLGAGAGMGVPNMVQAGLGQPASWGWPGAANWFGGGPMSMST